MTRAIGLVILAIIFLLIVISLILTLRGSPLQTKNGSPENIIQTYIESIIEEDFETSYSLLSEELKSECAFSDYVMNIEREIELFNSGTVKHNKTLPLEEDVHVILYIDISTVITDVPFGTDEYTREEKITLIKSEYPLGSDSSHLIEWRWEISKTSYLNSCEEFIKMQPPKLR
tara:strand:+ start:493 stop:1014 length:522 start_codon:yes stop_codon:yes gene_type:complete